MTPRRYNDNKLTQVLCDCIRVLKAIQQEKFIRELVFKTQVQTHVVQVPAQEILC